MKLTVLLICCALLLPAAAQSDSDRHLAPDYPSALCRSSAFAHGYIHGYEDGFRAGDIDIHMGRTPRATIDVKEYRQVPGYRAEFGDRSYFRLGYRQGFRAAYADALTGEHFRGVEQMRAAAEGIKGDHKSKQFDQALSAGYDAGRVRALEYGAQPELRYIRTHCLATRRNASYCDPYARGFNIGYADGFVLQRSRRMETARAGRE